MGKEFHLYKRLYFIFREYERIIKIWNSYTTNHLDEFYSDKFFDNIIIPYIAESSKEMSQYYECYSEEMNTMIKKIENLNLDIISRISSSGWSGNLMVLGAEEKINKIGQFILNYYTEAFEKKGSLTNIWISDEVAKFCYWSELGGGASLLNPKYEDFMIIDLK